MGWLSAHTSNPPCLVIDLRGPIAYRAGHIPGSMNMPSEQLDENCQFGVPFSTSNRVLFVCPTGDESRLFAAFLSQRGLDCASLSGGYIAWRRAGAPIEKSPNPKK